MTVLWLCVAGSFLGGLALDVVREVWRAIPPPARVATQSVSVAMAQVLVAKTALPAGRAVGAGSFRWQDWPQSALSPAYIVRSVRPDAIDTLVGAIARVDLLPGEPITAVKLAAKGQ